VPGVAAGVGPPIAAAARSVFFPLGGQLWSADGTPTGSVQLTNLPSDQALGPLVSYQGNLAFVVLSPSATSLWQSDGTPQGTVKLLDLPIPSGAQFDRLSTAGGLLFYTTLDPTQFTPPQVRRSDGTVAGTCVLASMLYLDSAPAAGFVGDAGFDYLISRDGNPPYERGIVTRTVVDSPPTASFTVTCVNRTCTVYPASFDPDGTSLTRWLWNWGDGSPTIEPTSPYRWAPQTYTYAHSGRYTITHTVYDTAGLSGSLEQAIHLIPGI
jgi:hypothetical protein